MNIQEIAEYLSGEWGYEVTKSEALVYLQDNDLNSLDELKAFRQAQRDEHPNPSEPEPDPDDAEGVFQYEKMTGSF